MTSDLEKTLIKRFPTLISKNLHFEIEDGWYQLVYDLFTKIEERCKLAKETVLVLQVKEKFGGLRVYYTTDCKDSTIFDLVFKAQDKSYTICEVTGGHGTLHEKGIWVKTLCNESAVLLGFTKVKEKNYGNV